MHTSMLKHRHTCGLACIYACGMCLYTHMKTSCIQRVDTGNTCVRMYAHYHKSYKYSQTMTLVRKLRVHPCSKSLLEVESKECFHLVRSGRNDTDMSVACVYTHICLCVCVGGGGGQGVCSCGAHVYPCAPSSLMHRPSSGTAKRCAPRGPPQTSSQEGDAVPYLEGGGGCQLDKQTKTPGGLGAQRPIHKGEQPY